MLVNVYYPDVVINIRDVKIAIDTGDKVGIVLEDHLDELDDNIAIKTSRESGIMRREKILGIRPLDTASLEDRRMEVLLRWYDTPIYTERILRQKLDAALGPENYTLTINLDDKIVCCEMKERSQNVVQSVLRLLEQMVPLDYGLEVIRYLELTNGFVNTGAYTGVSERIEIWPELASRIETAANVEISGSVILDQRIDIFPQTKGEQTWWQ